MKGILGVVRVVKQTAAHAEHHLAVSPHEQLKGGLIALGDKVLQQLAVGDLGGISAGDDPAQVLDNPVQLSVGHGPRSLEVTYPTLIEGDQGENPLILFARPAYQEIIGLGPAVVPLVLRELEQRPAHWFSALRALTGADPMDPADRGIAGKTRPKPAAWP